MPMRICSRIWRKVLLSMPMSWVVMLFLVGVVLLAAEVFVPGGVLGALGGLVMIGGCVLAFVEFGAGGGLLAVAAGVVLIIIMLVLEFVVLPKTRLGRRLFLNSEVKGASQAPLAAADVVVGKTGSAATALAPSGYVLVGGKRYEAWSQSGFLEKGAAICVVALDNFRLIVRRN